MSSPGLEFATGAQGVSELKQVTGSGHRELEKVFIAAINGGVNPQVMQAMRSLLDFIFISQSLLFSEETLVTLSDSLHNFHLSKESILKAGGRQGKKGSINHFCIPKLEMLHVIAAVHACWSPISVDNRHNREVPHYTRQGTI